MRLDELLVERGLARDLHDAQAYVMAGEVVVGEHRATSAGMSVKPDVALRLKDDKRRGGFVSRGGLKLQQALDTFGLEVGGLACADLGASSGGFTDCLLQRGAARVSAVDVGVGQFDWRLRNDPRVSLFERTNIRNVSAADIDGPFDLVVARPFVHQPCVCHERCRRVPEAPGLLRLPYQTAIRGIQGRRWRRGRRTRSPGTRSLHRGSFRERACLRIRGLRSHVFTRHGPCG